MTNPHDIEEQNAVLDEDVLTDEQKERIIAAELEADALAEENRAAIINRRRDRLSGAKAKGMTPKLIVSFFLVGTALTALFILPDLLTGGQENKKDEVEVSKVDLAVEKVPPKKDFQLDLGAVIAGPEKKEADLDEQVYNLQKKLDELQAAPKDNTASEAAVKAIVDKVTKEFEAKLEAQQVKLKAENERLKKEAEVQAEVERLEKAALAEFEEQQKQIVEIEKLELEKKTKQEVSSLLVLDGSEENAGPGGENDGGLGGGGGGGGRSSGTKHQQFLESSANSTHVTTWAKSMADPSKTVVQGTIISGVLETAIDTQLPGSLRAQVTEPVFSFDGSRILIPAGTSLIGSYSTDIDFEQKRVLISWNRAITPDGDSIAIGGVGADVLGRTGTAGNVDNRYGKKFGAAVLMSALSIAPAILSQKLAPAPATPKAPTQVLDSSGQPTISLNVGGGDGLDGGLNGSVAQGDPYSDALTGVTEPVTGTLEKFLELGPVIRVPQGEEIRVFVTRDLIFR